MLTRGTHVALLAAGALLLSAVVPPPVNTGQRPPPKPPQQSAGAVVGPNGMTASVSSTSLVGGSVPFERTVRVQVPVMCWMSAGPTGAEYAALWGEGGESNEANLGSGGYSYIRLVYPDFQKYADVPGHWYTSSCRPDAPPAVVVEYQRTHQPRYVELGDPAPAVEPEVDPRVLMEAARDSMVLPTGTIRWNPSMAGTGATVVNLPTFVWVENSTTAVQVRAQIDGTNLWAQIDATLATLELQAPGYGVQDKPCTDNGTPYAPGMTTSSCSITFTRSTAKDGPGLPTTTLTATASWTASWTSSLDATPRALEIPPTTASAEVPVAEIQTVVTR